MAYRGAVPSARNRRQTFTYLPQPRGCVAWLFDAVVVIAIVTLALGLARKDTVSCVWPERGPGHCQMTTENAVGMTSERTIDGIHGMAFRSARQIGFVTDAGNKDRDAAFATRSIEMWDDASADDLEAFGNASRGQRTFTASRGPSSPMMLGAGFFALLAVYVIATRRTAMAVTIDTEQRMLFVSPRAWFGRSERFELAKVRGIEVENADIARHRVRLVLLSGQHVPLTRSFSPGAHHRAFAEEVSSALRT